MFSRLWAYQPATLRHVFDLMGETHAEHDLSFRQRGILVTACASTLDDAYCSLAWGTKLSSKSDTETAAGILRGDDIQLSPQEQALARWARRVASDSNRTTAAGLQALRDVGFSDGQIFAITAYVALSIAFSTVNAALGARPDSACRSTAPESVLEAVTYGRPIEE
jgi:alkylhydroperoxidase family enzyme